MLINYMKEAYPNFLEDPPNITDLTKFYKAAKLRFDESDAFKEVSLEGEAGITAQKLAYAIRYWSRVDCRAFSEISMSRSLT